MSRIAMTTSMQQQPTDNQRLLWRQRSALKRGLALCVIILCTALAVSIAMIASNYVSRDASVDAPGMQPTKAEALMWGHLWRKRYKKIKNIVTTSAVARWVGIKPESVPPQTTNFLSTTVATQRDGFEPELTPPRTTKPKEVVSTTAATRRDGFEPELTPPQTAKLKEVLSKTALAQLKATVPTREPSNSSHTCNTAGCMLAASMILNNRGRSVDPCEDFYGYACGNFTHAMKIPDGKDFVEPCTMIWDELQEKMIEYFDTDSELNKHKYFTLAKNFYASCMNAHAVEAKATGSLRSILQQLGGWPVLVGDSWNATGFEWKNSIYQLFEIGYSANYFIKVEVDVDSKNRSKYALYLDRPSFGLRPAYLIKGFDNVNCSTYYNYMVDIAVILGANTDTAQRELKESLKFEMDLANISLIERKPLGETQGYNPMTLKELMGRYSSIPWKEYFSRLFPSTITIEEGDVVIVKAPTYLAEFEKLISATTKRVQANYVMWRSVKYSTKYLNEKVHKRELEYLNDMGYGTGNDNGHELRRKKCIEEVMAFLPDSIGAIFVRKYFHEDAKKNVDEIVINIKRGFAEMLKKVDWMDEETRRSALEKLAAMSYHIGYPAELADENKVDKYYENFASSEDDYLRNTLNYIRFANKYLMSNFRKAVNKTDWCQDDHMIQPIAKYDWEANSVCITAGYMQGAYFNKNRPQYMNYGTLGVTIGHEIAHGLHNFFVDHARCLTHQYSNYFVEEVGLNVNGVTTLRDNIADNAGLKVAYDEYNNWVARNGEEEKLPGIVETPKQLFWLSNANMHCSKSTLTHLKYRINEDAHSPVEFRVLGPMSNLPEFAEDFMCSKGSKMNPKKKCSVW